MSNLYNKNSKYISVFIPVFNGERYIGECIDSILNQELPAGYSLEIIVIDSGSTDDSVSMLNSYGEKIKLQLIPNEEFSHGETRQKASELAKGEYILFLTQDATPAHSRWIINMLEPFFISDKIGCVVGRQIPRSQASPTIKREVFGAFGALGSLDSITLHRHESLIDSKPTNPINTFFSDANSAVRRSLLIDKVPFRKINYAEDQALALDMQRAGYLKAYAPLGEVMHSNEYTAKQYFHRKFDEYVGLYDSIGLSFKPSRKNLLLGWIRPTLKDYLFIKNDDSYSIKRRVYWFVFSPFYNIASVAGRYYASKNLTNDVARKKLSLEQKSKSK